MKTVIALALLLASCASPCTNDADLIAFGQKESLRFFAVPNSVTYTVDTTFTNFYGDVVAKGSVTAKNALGMDVVSTYWIGTTCEDGEAQLKSFSVDGGKDWYAKDRQ